MNSGPRPADQLPVAAVLDQVGAALRRRRRVIVQAPPGSGKTTLVPPFLLRSGLCPDGEVLLLQPRRVAARTVARRLARSLGAEVGGLVGYQVRFDTRVSPSTRIRVVTEGILTARLQGDPELAGVAAVVLDEVHERSLHTDLALALVREVQEALRDDLLLVVMSATLDPVPLARYLGDCPVVSSDGRLHPVALDYLERPATGPLEETVARGVLSVVDADPGGDVLTFLPGVREIEAARSALAEPLRRRGWDVAVLYGRLPPAAQDAALEPGPRSRVVLATNIAETSLTIAGVCAVVDSGLAKVMRFEPRLGAGRLYTERISHASAEQRAGRAGRLGPGRALRLWTAHEHRALAAFDEPAICREDLARFVLELHAWGVSDPARFALFEPADPARLDQAEALLRSLTAVDAEGRVTPEGEMLRHIPAHPRTARFLIEAARQGLSSEAGRWAAALELGARADASSNLPAAAARLAAGGPRHAAQLARQLAGAARRRVTAASASAAGTTDVGEALVRCLLRGYPDRLARRRAPDADAYLLAGGRGARLFGDDRPALLLALDLDAGQRGAGSVSLIRRWVAVEVDWLEGHPDRDEADVLRWDPARARVMAERVQRYRDLVLERRPVPLADRAAAAATLMAQAARDPLQALGALDAVDETVLSRLLTLSRAFPELALPDSGTAWLRRILPALCVGRSSFAELRRAPLGPALLASLDWRAGQHLRESLPERIKVPSGSRIRLRYQADGPPILAVKVQELFGLRASPTVAGGRMPCLLHLLSPAGRPLQVTMDLASFWSRTWPQVRAEMRSRYPKHRWPEDPLTAEPSRHTTQRRRG